MGSVLGGAMKETMDNNMKKNQEFMLETQKIQVRQCYMSLENWLVLLVCQSNIHKTHYPRVLTRIQTSWNSSFFAVSDGCEKFLQ